MAERDAARELAERINGYLGNQPWGGEGEDPIVTMIREAITPLVEALELAVERHETWNVTFCGSEEPYASQRERQYLVKRLCEEKIPAALAPWRTE